LAFIKSSPSSCTQKEAPGRALIPARPARPARGPVSQRLLITRELLVP